MIIHHLPSTRICMVYVLNIDVIEKDNRDKKKRTIFFEIEAEKASGKINTKLYLIWKWNYERVKSKVTFLYMKVNPFMRMFNNQIIKFVFRKSFLMTTLSSHSHMFTKQQIHIEDFTYALYDLFNFPISWTYYQKQTYIRLFFDNLIKINQLMQFLLKYYLFFSKKCCCI